MGTKTSYRIPLLLAAALALPGHSAQAQAFTASVGVGSLFDGVGFGLSVGGYAPGSAFFGVSLGLGWAHRRVSPYGIYSDTYDGWRMGYRGHAPRAYAYAGCWDAYWDPFWDPWYDNCYALGPAWGFAFHRSWGWSAWPWSWYGPRSTFVILRDPWAAPWGHYWSYDPWGGHWDRWGYAPRGYYGGVRVVYGGGRSGWGVAHPSPLARRGPTYKESPGQETGRIAHRRGTPVAAPARPTVQGNPRGVPGWGNTGRTAQPRQPQGGVGAPARGTASRSGAPGAVSGRRPGDGAATGRPSAPAAGRATPRAGAASATAPAAPRPTDRLRGERRGGGVTSRAVPRVGATRSTPTRTPAARSAPLTNGRPSAVAPRTSAPRGTAPRASTPRAAPRTSTRGATPPRMSAPRAAPGTSAPRAAPRTSVPRASTPRATAPRSAPKASAPKARSGGAAKAPPPRRTGGGGGAAPPRRGGGGGL